MRMPGGYFMPSGGWRSMQGVTALRLQDGVRTRGGERLAIPRWLSLTVISKAPAAADTPHRLRRA